MQGAALSSRLPLSPYGTTSSVFSPVSRPPPTPLRPPLTCRPRPEQCTNNLKTNRGRKEKEKEREPSQKDVLCDSQPARCFAVTNRLVYLLHPLCLLIELELRINAALLFSVKLERRSVREKNRRPVSSPPSNPRGYLWIQFRDVPQVCVRSQCLCCKRQDFRSILMCDT